jgi:hypothetical protein
MRQRQVLVCDGDGMLAQVLREPVQARGWRLSEVRHPRVCLGLLPQGGDSVFVLRAGRDLVDEMTLLQQVANLFPETATIVVCDADNQAVSGLAWDLGAKFVLHPAQISDMLPDIVAGFLQ